MDIKLELIMGAIYDTINERIGFLDIDVDEIADTTAIAALSEIQEIIQNENYSDFEKIEEIMSVFEKYNLSFGECHDY